MLEKIDTFQNNKEKSYTEKKAKHVPSGYSLVTCCSYDKSKNVRNYYRGKDCIEMFCKDLREQAMKIINYEKKETIPLTNEEKESYKNQKVYYICEKEFSTDKKDQKVKDHCYYTGNYRGAAHNSCNLRYKIPKEIPLVFHNGSTYDYHFIIVELAKGKIDCLGEITEKCITFSVTIEIANDNNKTIKYKIKVIESSLSSLVDNLSEINNKETND